MKKIVNISDRVKTNNLEKSKKAERFEELVISIKCFPDEDTSPDELFRDALLNVSAAYGELAQGGALANKLTEAITMINPGEERRWSLMLLKQGRGISREEMEDYLAESNFH